MSHHEKLAQHPNATAAREVTEAMQRGDIDAMRAGLAEDVEWHEIGRDEPIVGRDAVIARFTDWSRFTDEPPDLKVDVHDIVANDDHVVVLVTATVTKGAKSITYRTAEIMHVRDGQVTARWAFSDDTARINEFFANL